MPRRLTLILSFDNKSLMISIFSFSTAKYNAVLYNNKKDFIIKKHEFGFH